MVPDVKQSKQLPEGWEFKQLSSLFQERRETSSDLEKYPLYSLTIEEGLIEKPERYNREFLLKNRQGNQYRLVYPGDFVFNPMNLRWGAIAMSSLSKPVTVSAYYNVLSSDSSIIPSNLMLTILQSPQMLNVYDTVGKGTLVEKKRVHLNVFLKLKIPVPPITQSKKINAILSSVDGAIASTQAVIDQTRKVKQGLLQQLLTRGIGHTRFKESAIGEIPETWKVVAFESLAQIGPQNGIYKSKDDYGSGTPMIDMGDIFKLDIIDEAERRCVRLTEEEQEKFTLQYGDLLFARRSLVVEGSGKCAMVGHHSIRPVFESSIIRFRLKSSICNSLFYFYYWESPIGKKLRRGITRQVAVSGVTGKDLEKLPIALPPLDEQVKITSILKSLDEDIASHEVAITRLNSIKRGLMQDLLTGKVRVGCTS